MSQPRSTTRPFPPYQRERAAAERQAAATADKGHGRCERRTLTSTTALNGYLDWPGVGQVFRLVRERTTGGVTTTEVVYGITSLTPARADAAQLLELARTHWSVENQLFGVRDGTLREDACRVRTGSAPQALAGLRNVVVCLLAGVDAPSRAAATRRLAVRTRQAVELLHT